MHGHVPGSTRRRGVCGDEAAQLRGEARAGFDDVQAAAPGQLRYQGASDRSGAGAGFQD
jgi:hypothetical protein